MLTGDLRQRVLRCVIKLAVDKCFTYLKVIALLVQLLIYLDIVPVFSSSVSWVFFFQSQIVHIF